MKKKDDDSDRISDRDNYVKNRTIVLEDFASYLEEVQREKPSLSGVIAGMDYKQFALAAAFREIRQQELYTKETKVDFINPKEEKEILKQMVKDAKKVFKKDYQALYDFYAKDSTDYD